MNADTTQAMDHARKPEHACIDVGHHECEVPRDSGIGSTQLRKELDNFPVRTLVSGDVSGHSDSELTARDVRYGCAAESVGSGHTQVRTR